MSALESAIIYRGPSMLDGAPIVAIITRIADPSSNPKTGPMAQVFVLRADAPPVGARRTGDDFAICGGCKFRPINAAPGAPVCYVQVGQSPTTVFYTFARGGYPTHSPATVRAELERRGRRVRFGAYGDPAAVPAEVWRELGAVAHTGYTHQWRTVGAELADTVMASCDSSQDRADARAAGFRTFRVIRDVAELEAGEILCPTDPSAPKRRRDGAPVTCATCGLCDGRRGANDRRADVAILDHGVTAPKRRRNLRAVPMAPAGA